MPFNRKPPQIFFGWWIVGASFFIALYVGGVIFYGFTAIIKPIADELGWSYTQISFAASIRGLEVSLLAPLVGAFTDRWGPRRLILGGATISALGLILLSRATSLVTFYGAFVLIAIGVSSCSLTVLMIALANWFKGKMGIASGIANAGFGFSGLLIPVIVSLIEIYKWRTTVIILALGMLVTVLPLSLFFRHKPEQYGYLPDGQVHEPIASGLDQRRPQTTEIDIKVKKALKNRAFWCITAAFLYHAMLVHAIITHVMPFLGSIGADRWKSGIVATLIPLISIVGRLGFGWLGDKFDKRLVAKISFAMMGLGSLCFGYASPTVTWVLVPFLVLFGVGYGGGSALRAPLVREYFGRANFGTIFGLIIGISMLGSIIGPPLAGWVYDNWGSYRGIWFVLAGLSAAAVMFILSIPRVRGATQPVDIT